METRGKKPKEKRRNNEKRKEKSRDAARCRRSRETDIFAELAAVLPIPPDQAAHLDKASVMRLAIAYLKARSVVDALSEPVMKTEKFSDIDTFCQKALDGFMLILSSNGDMVYLSENVSDYLGIAQMDMMGQSVFEYSHPCDHDEIRQCLSITPADVTEKRACNFFLRLKCTLTNKGRKVNLKSASYKVIHCIGHPMLISEPVSDGTEELDDHVNESSGSSGSGSEDSQDGTEKRIMKPTNSISLVVVGCPIPHPSNIEIPLGRHTFLSKHNLNMKFTYADDRLSEYLGWESNELMGKSVFEFHHALDNSALNKSFKSLFSKGQCETMAYRFLNKTGGYAWVVTQATLIRCSKQGKPLSVVCVNYILSGIECKDEVYSVRQLEARSAVEKLEETVKTKEEDLILLPPALAPIEAEIVLPEVEPIIPIKRTRPQTVTASLFKDLNQEAKKEIASTNEIAKERNCKEKRSSWIFQEKPIIDYDTSRHRTLTRPQAVTRNLFSICQENQQGGGTCRPPPQTATASIFAPRTEDMNKGFLTFSEDQPGLTMLKDEPEDLTHLAPTPGDVCVPLEDTPFLSDMLDEFILGNEVYCPLLSPSLPPELHDSSELSDEPDKTPDSLSDNFENSVGDSDPFFYKDTSPSPGCTQTSSNGLLTPVLGRSPNPHSLDSSLRSPSDDGSTPLGSGISEDDMLMLSINDVIADEELALRAPYIPMSDQDEALQLLISDDMVMWGPTQATDKKIKWDTEDEMSRRYADSSLAKLLKTSTEDLEKHSTELVDPVQVLGQTCRRGASIKRHHGPNSSHTSGDSKRIRSNHEPKDRSSITADKIPNELSSVFTGAGTTIADVESPDVERIEDIDELKKQPGNLLMEQLLGQQSFENGGKRTIFDKKRDDIKEDDSGGGFNGDNVRQSNSVLMNLLVSGCDETYIDLPQLVSEKCQPLMINTDINQPNDRGKTYLTAYTMNPQSPSPKRLLQESLSSNRNSINDTINSPSIGIDDYHYVMGSSTPLSPGSELLRVLSEVV